MAFDRDVVRIALLLPQAGAIGMWAPSAEKCAQLAIAELNAARGLGGRRIAYEKIDASGDPHRVARATLDLIERQGIEAVIGMHTSDIRTAVGAELTARVPYLFGPMYEGGESRPGVYLLGETPQSLFAPMLSWMSRELGASRWFLIGNSYNYPYLSNQQAKLFIEENGGSVVGEDYVAIDDEDFSASIAAILASRADSVLVNLVGLSAVGFHRAFAQAGLSERLLRFCGVLEENTILALGPEGNTGMFTATGYFDDLDTTAARAFKERYHAAFGYPAPILNQFAISCYEAIHCLAQFADAAGSLDTRAIDAIPERRLEIPGPRGPLHFDHRHSHAPVHLTHVEALSIAQIG